MTLRIGALLSHSHCAASSSSCRRCCDDEQGPLSAGASTAVKGKERLTNTCLRKDERCEPSALRLWSGPGMHAHTTEICNGRMSPIRGPAAHLLHPHSRRKITMTTETHARSAGVARGKGDVT